MEFLLSSYDECPRMKVRIPVCVFFEHETKRFVAFGNETPREELDAIKGVRKNGNFAEYWNELRKVRESYEKY